MEEDTKTINWKRTVLEGTKALLAILWGPMSVVIQSAAFIGLACIPLVFILNQALSYRTNIRVSFGELWMSLVALDMVVRLGFK